MRTSNNKGFSLVELIIVIAIMAVLVGMVGTQVIPYINNAKRSKDVQILSAIQTASVAAYSKKVDAAPTSGTMKITITAGLGGTDNYTCDISTAQEIGDEAKFLVSIPYVSEANARFSSKTFSGIDKIEVVFDFDNNTVEVHAYESGSEKTQPGEITAKL